MTAIPTFERPCTLWERGPVNPAHPATLIYRDATPDMAELAVQHTDQPDEEDVTTSYQIDLSLLGDGMRWRVADNGVTVRPHDTVPGWVVVKLASYSDVTEFYADGYVISQFLDGVTFSRQAETFDMDALAARLLEVSA